MTSGIFQTFPLDKIIINRETRQRREVGSVADLVASIPEAGLINPPVIKRDGTLVAGERRVTACRELGWTSIPVQFVDELSEDELHLIELEENTKRQDLSWQDMVLATEEYDRLRKARDPNWKIENTSEALGISATRVYKHISVAKELRGGNEKLAKLDRLSTAINVIAREAERKRASIAKSISLDEPTPPAVAEASEGEKPAPLLHADFSEWWALYEGEPFNMIHCDFPYGVGMDKSDYGAGDEFGTYEDDPDVYWNLLREFAKSMDTLVAESAHLIFWFSMDFYYETKTQLEAMGWRVQAHPLVWYKSDNIGIMPDPARQPRRIYETAFLASRGDRLLVQPVSNVFAAPGRGKAIHMNEKPVAMLRHFMRMTVDKYSVVLDPTCGSGNALKAAEALEAASVLGLEKNEEFFNRAKEAYHDVFASEV